MHRVWGYWGEWGYCLVSGLVGMQVVNMGDLPRWCSRVVPDRMMDRGHWSRGRAEMAWASVRWTGAVSGPYLSNASKGRNLATIPEIARTYRFWRVSLRTGQPHARQGSLGYPYTRTPQQPVDGLTGGRRWHYEAGRTTAAIVPRRDRGIGAAGPPVPDSRAYQTQVREWVSRTPFGADRGREARRS